MHFSMVPWYTGRVFFSRILWYHQGTALKYNYKAILLNNNDRCVEIVSQKLNMDRLHSIQLRKCGQLFSQTNFLCE